ncbi:MAG: hypothetical protein LBQ88_06885 [Treponema sp.]|jgi:hypothetical protein|nr:hypothetical protein [Treponema sp.]
MGFTMAEKKKITERFAPRYRKANKAGKTRILDEYLELAGETESMRFSNWAGLGKRKRARSTGSALTLK